MCTRWDYSCEVNSLHNYTCSVTSLVGSTPSPLPSPLDTTASPDPPSVSRMEKTSQFEGHTLNCSDSTVMGSENFLFVVSLQHTICLDLLYFGGKKKRLRLKTSFSEVQHKHMLSLSLSLIKR